MLLNSPEFKVGALVVIVSSIIGGMTLTVAKGPGFLSGSKHHWFTLDDANGLVNSSAVKMAGIKVGVIKEIELVDGKARLHLSLDEDVPVTRSAKVEIRADGILGDKHVELLPGNEDVTPLKDGEPITNITRGDGLGHLMKEVGKVTQSLSHLAKTLNDAVQGSGDKSTPIERIVLNIENLTKDLADISGENKEKIGDMVDRMQKISITLDEVINDTSPEGFRSAWQNAVDGLQRVDTSLKNIEEITDKVNRGEGTLGRLVNDEATVEKLNTAIDNVNEFMGSANEMETNIDFHSEYLTTPELVKSYLNVKIQLGLDRYYLLGVVDDPRGVTRVTRTETTPQDGSVSAVDELKTFKGEIKFNALFAKNFYNFTVKGGIIENASGFGVDYHLMRKKLMLSLEMFDFHNVYVRAFAKYSFFKGVYIIGGGDNLAQKGAGSFIGGGIFITNDDLKTLAARLAF